VEWEGVGGGGGGETWGKKASRVAARSASSGSARMARRSGWSGAEEGCAEGSDGAGGRGRVRWVGAGGVHPGGLSDRRGLVMGERAGERLELLGEGARGGCRGGGGGGAEEGGGGPGPELEMVAASPRRGEEEEGGGRGGGRRGPPYELPRHRRPWPRGLQPVARASSAGRGGGAAARSNLDLCLCQT
jgi:hypothetical protein